MFYLIQLAPTKFFQLFLGVVTSITHFHLKKNEAEVVPLPPEPSREEILLSEIKDVLKAK